MNRQETACPTCHADIPLAGDERPGEEVFCSACGAPCRLVGSADDEELAAEEDY